ncbi:MAG: cytochrome-c peroxidase [Planctomycetota bacterium]|jgi:cytochrome c peroxidase
MRSIVGLFVLSLAVVASFAVRGEAERAPKRHGSIVELGRRLFMDPAVSRNGKFACASCHLPEHGFSDPRVVSEDENGKTARHSQTLIDLEDGKGFHWDGEFDMLHELLRARLADATVAVAQANELHTRHFNAAKLRGDKPHGPIYRSKLKNLTPPYYGPNMRRRTTAPVPTPVARRVESGGRYAEGFRRAYGNREVTVERIVQAMRRYMLSIRSHEAPFDRFLAGDKTAISAAAQRGFELFSGKADCAACHTGGYQGKRLQLTDHAFRNTGVAFKKVQLDFVGKFTADTGFGAMTFVAADLGKFKTPTLRDVERRPPYMHDGSLKTLEEVVRYYDRGGTANGRLHENIKPLGLTDGEVADLVAFLKTLTSDVRPGLGPVAAHRPSRTRIRLVAPNGRPRPNFEVDVEVFGDRLTGALEKAPEPLRLRSDANGWVTFRFPLWTHVTLHAARHEIGEGRPLPDYVRQATLIVTPEHQISVRIVSPESVKTMPGRVAAYSPKGKKHVLAVFKRIRRLAPNEALYVAPRGKLRGLQPAFLDYRPEKSRAGAREIDLSGGASETIDLR